MKIETNPFLRRYCPNSRFNNGEGFNKSIDTIVKFEDFGESITDKESYRLSLLGHSTSGAIGTSPSGGTYAFPDGKYDYNKDISYVLRPDLTSVQIDEYIKAEKAYNENNDLKLKSQIKKESDASKVVINNDHAGNTSATS